MSASAVRIQANRANAQLSTGPQTPEGKQRSALNSLRHGLTAKDALLPSESLEAYREFCRAIVDDLRPQGAYQQQLAQSVADIRWRLRRCLSLEDTVFASEPDPARQIEAITRLSAYEHRLHRNLDMTLDQFCELRDREERAMKDASKILKLCRSKQLPYNPADDGFVFSASQLDAWLQRKERLQEADLACHIEQNQRFFARH